MCAPLKVKSKKLPKMRVRKTIEIERVKMPPPPSTARTVCLENPHCVNIQYPTPSSTPEMSFRCCVPHALLDEKHTQTHCFNNLENIPSQIWVANIVESAHLTRKKYIKNEAEI